MRERGGAAPNSSTRLDSTLGIDGLADVVPIGSGGAATVYRARQVAFDRPVAVKLLSAPISDGAARSRFEREQQLTGRLTGHPNIARVFEAGFSSLGQPYLVMEYYAGGTLRDAVARHGPQDVSTVMMTGVKLSGALATAHAAGILHRDIKPANVLLDQFAEPHLADFGIAGMADDSAELTHAYTTRYAAPEVLARNPTYSAAADQYSLALTLIFLLTGAPPADDHPLAELDRKALNVPQPLRAVLARALADDPAERFASTAELGQALQQAQRTLGESATALRVMDPTQDTTPNQDATMRIRPAASPNSPGLALPSGYWTGSESDDEELTRLRNAAANPESIRRKPSRRMLIFSSVAFALIVIFSAIAGVFVKGEGSGGGSGDESNQAQPAAIELHAPTNVTIAQDTPGKLVVTWTDTNNGQSAYAGYTLAGGTEPGQRSIDFATEKGATSATTPGLPPGVRHCVMVFPIAATQTSQQRTDVTATACD